VVGKGNIWRHEVVEVAARADRSRHRWEVLPGAPVERRLMFGYPAGFVNGNMFCGLFQDGLVLRLDDKQRDKLLKVKGCKPFEPMKGRPMKQYVLVPGSLVKDEDAITPWLEAALNYASKLPPKKKTPKTKKKK
jgi:TfoX/Sxy family transcriptional regulator of competence genes